MKRLKKTLSSIFLTSSLLFPGFSSFANKSANNPFLKNNNPAPLSQNFQKNAPLKKPDPLLPLQKNTPPKFMSGEQLVLYYLQRMAEAQNEQAAALRAQARSERTTGIIIAIAILLWMGVSLYRWSKQNKMQKGMMGGKGSGAFTVIDPENASGQNAAQKLAKFSDVAGLDRIVSDTTEIVDFLKDREKFLESGAKIPRGVLLSGPPGVGKTLIAKAIAGEAGMPFISVSGSSFVEMYVGVGASRVRELFKQAREKAAKSSNQGCVIFIDEIDAVGKKRGGAGNGGNDEREQTLNQMLVEMNGFDSSENIVIIAATNRADMLDDALLRPGRFDRKISVPLPDMQARRDIINVHAKNKKLADDADLESLARNTSGGSGADLANIINEAAISAVREKRTKIKNEDLKKALREHKMGVPRSPLGNPKFKESVAYHESGHALLGTLLNDFSEFKVESATICPTSKAVGYVDFSPEEDLTNYSKAGLMTRLYTALAGQVAEEFIEGKNNVSDGPRGDLEQATKIVKAMVEEFGMFGDEFGIASFAKGPSGNSTGGGAYEARVTEFVEKKLKEVKDEVRVIIEDNQDALDRLAQKLIDKETIYKEEIQAALEGIQGIPHFFTNKENTGRGSRLTHPEPVEELEQDMFEVFEAANNEYPSGQTLSA